MQKIVSIVCSSAAKCIDSFPRPLLLRIPLDNGVVARKVGCPLSANSNSISSAILSQAPCGLFSAEYHLFSDELQAARAEQERRILQEELWRQQKDFREVHQQSLTEMEELRKFQSSTFDTLARRKLIEDQNTIMELSGRVQELQNEVNCMNDSKDFQEC